MSEFIFLLTGIAIGFAVGYFFVKNRFNDTYKNFLADKEKEIQTLTLHKIEAEAELKILKNSSEKLSQNFENIANKTIVKNNEVFLKTAERLMTRYSEESSKELQNKEKSISALLKPISESFEKHEKTMSEMSSKTDKSIAGLQSFLHELSKNHKNLEKETGALVNALKSPKVRGRWGEIGLKRIVEFSGMSEYCDFSMQVNVNTEEGRLRPDMIVNLPGNKHIVIDSKLPLNSYLNMLETENEEDKKDLLRKHAKAVAEHVRLLSAKSYWSQFEETVDFVVLYIEVESAFGAALSVNKELISYAIENRIVFATPTTLIALLQTVAYSWKQHTATENALKIWKASKELYERTAVFSEFLEKLGAGISNTVKTYNQAIGSWESRLLPGIKKMEDLGVSSEKKNIKEQQSIDVITRGVNKKNTLK